MDTTDTAGKLTILAYLNARIEEEQGRAEAAERELDAVRTAAGAYGDSNLVSYVTGLAAGYKQFEDACELLDTSSGERLPMSVAKLLGERDELRKALADVLEYDDHFSLMHHACVSYERAAEILRLIEPE